MVNWLTKLTLMTCLGGSTLTWIEAVNWLVELRFVFSNLTLIIAIKFLFLIVFGYAFFEFRFISFA